jgi:hypothetical protein
VEADERGEARRAIPKQCRARELGQPVALAVAFDVAAAREHAQRKLERVDVELERIRQIGGRPGPVAERLEDPKPHAGHQRTSVEQRQERVEQGARRRRRVEHPLLQGILGDRAVPHRLDPIARPAAGILKPCRGRTSSSSAGRLWP